MLIVIGRARAEDGRRDDLVAATRKVALATRNDPGCAQYSFAVDVTDADVVLSLEVWRDQAALDAHLAHEHTTTFLAEVGDMVAGTPTMSFFHADANEGTPS